MLERVPDPEGNIKGNAEKIGSYSREYKNGKTMPAEDREKTSFAKDREKSRRADLLLLLEDPSGLLCFCFCFCWKIPGILLNNK